MNTRTKGRRRKRGCGRACGNEVLVSDRLPQSASQAAQAPFSFIWLLLSLRNHPTPALLCSPLRRLEPIVSRPTEARAVLAHRRSR